MTQIDTAHLMPNITIDKDGVSRIGMLPTREEFDAAERVRLSKYYLVRNDGGDFGERMPCRRGRTVGADNGFDRGHIHAHFTCMCVERPFRGIEDGLRAWIRAASPGTRRSKILSGMINGLRDYSSSHPETAQALTPATPDTLAWYGVVAGALEPISEERARRLAERIKDRNPEVFPFELLSLLGPVPRSIR